MLFHCFHLQLHISLLNCHHTTFIPLSYSPKQILKRLPFPQQPQTHRFLQSSEWQVHKILNTHTHVWSLGQTENQSGVRQMLPPDPPVLLPLVRHSCSHLEIKERGQSTGERLTASFYRLQVNAALPDGAERRAAEPRRPTWWLDYEPRYLRTCGKADGEDFFS